MRFNKMKPNNNDDNNDEFQRNSNLFASSSSTSMQPSSEMNTNNLFVVGTIKVDEHSRLTFSKRIKTVFPVFPGDTIAVYQEMATNDLIFKVQRYNEVTDIWSIKRKKNNVTSLTNNNPLKEKYNKKNENLSNVYVKNKRQIPQLTSEIKIMIIDDEPDVIETYKVALYEYSKEEYEKPYVITTFASSIDAAKHFLEISRDNKNSTPYYDLIIIDVKIPDINGIQLYQILKIIDLNSKIIFISALDAVNDLAGVLPGIKLEDIIKKPCDIGEFYSKVKDKIHSYN
jgi:CheY-like chemotaxis protein